MESLYFEYAASGKIAKRSHVGVAGSGDLEILLEPSPDECARVSIRTSAEGFSKRWQALFDRFFATHDYAVAVHINDFGATPGVVSLRLAQAVEVAQT
ncbi:malonate decarboxylase subunit delta [Paenibacillus hodogayensis]|uniref:Malonate decarboxylase acyl carrier protein n=1 Tax=Paenibacillus hodogayensis TaxID=279208 RepID=A0ABV5VPI8_9BACL